MKQFTKLYIDGQWAEPAGQGMLDVVNSTTEEIMGRVPEGAPEDIERAVQAARSAFDNWSISEGFQRAEILDRISRGLEQRRRELAELIAREVGMPMPLSIAIQAGLPATVAESYARLAESYPFEEEVGNSLVLREAVGVVGCITPWNYPLHQIVAKVAPALAAGCCVIVKPSEVAPLNAFVLAEIIHEAGLPAGVFNLVSGLGSVVGEALASHPEVDMMSFTGSTRAGRRVAEIAAQSVKRVTQELGGKSANIVLEGANFERGVKTGVKNCFLNSGQTCSAWTRMLVPRGQQDQAIEIARQVAEGFRAGDPLKEGSNLGPLVSAAQRERVRSYIRQGIEEGATLVTGGPEAPQDLPTGFFVKPTVFANVTSDMVIAREEIFGPVLSIMPYDSEDDAVRIANDSKYGLAGAVWSSDPKQAQRVARRLRTVQVDINGGRYNPLAPFGGYKQSGNGRELGRFGLEEFLEIKSLQM